MLSEEKRSVHVFNMFVETNFCLHLVAQINKYTVSSTAQNDSGYSNSGTESKWFDTTIDEIKAFISLCIIQSCFMNDNLQVYWCTQKSTQTPLFPSVMSFKQYKLQHEFLHFIDNAELDVSDRLAKVRHPTDYFNNKFQTLYTLKQDTAI